MMLRLLLSTVLVLSVVFSLTPTTPVLAYEVTVDPDTGNEVYQPNSCFYYSVNERGSDNIFMTDLSEIIRASFDAWEDVSCSYFYFMDTKPTTVDKAEYNQDKGNVNLLVWREEMEDWPAEFSNNAIAMTSVTYNLNSFDILDTDIEFNGAHFEFGTVENGGDNYFVDLQTVITHEIGHAIGLNDLYDPQYKDSTMYGVDIHDSDGSATLDKRSLHQDDINGLCYIYQVDEDLDVCEEPLCGLDLDGTSSSCRNTSSGSGCQVASSGLRPATSLLSRLLDLL
jgi:hypothetical protein